MGGGEGERWVGAEWLAEGDGLQWRIQLWADRAAPHIDQNLLLVVTARSSLPQTLGQVFI